MVGQCVVAHHLSIVRSFSKRVQFNKQEMIKEWKKDWTREELKPDYEVTVERKNITLGFSCSSGPGGQNANNVKTKVELRFSLDDCDWMPEVVKERFRENNRNRITKDNEFVLSCETFRTQYENKDAAFSRLEDLVNESCFPTRDRSESEQPEYYKEKQKESNKLLKNKRSDKKQMKSRGW